MSDRDMEIAGPSSSIKYMKSERKKGGGVAPGFSIDLPEDWRNVEIENYSRNRSLDATPEKKKEQVSEHDSSDSTGKLFTY